MTYENRPDIDARVRKLTAPECRSCRGDGFLTNPRTGKPQRCRDCRTRKAQAVDEKPPGENLASREG